MKCDECGNGDDCLLFLRGGLEQKLADTAHSHALDKILKGAVLVTLLATAVFFAARQELPDLRGPNGIDRDAQRREECGLAPIKINLGYGLEMKRLSHRCMSDS